MSNNGDVSLGKLEITLTCLECGSGVHIHPSVDAKQAQCDVCQTMNPVNFSEDHERGVVKQCPKCERKDFFKQKDFNRKIGVGLFVLGAISVPVFLIMGVGFPWIYSVFFFMVILDIALYFLLPLVVVCYKCDTIFRGAANIEEIHGFNHEMHDRIVYSDHNFEGKTLDH